MLLIGKLFMNTIEKILARCTCILLWIGVTLLVCTSISSAATEEDSDSSKGTNLVPVSLLSYLGPEVDFFTEFLDEQGRPYFKYRDSSSMPQKVFKHGLEDSGDGSVTVTLGEEVDEPGRDINPLDGEDDGSVTVHLSSLGSGTHKDFSPSLSAAADVAAFSGGGGSGGGSAFVPETGDRAEKVLSPVDGREEVLTPKEFPWRAHGHMLLKYSTRVYIGSGTMIGARMVLTAAHNLYDSLTKEFAREVSFFPGLGRGDNITLPITGSKAISMKVHKSYYAPVVGEDPREYDIGLLMLAEFLTDRWYGVKTLSDTLLSRLRVTIAGYPGDKDSGRVMYSMSGKISKVTDRQLFYGIDTAGGQSGSGVWYADRDGIAHFCVGVHTYGGHKENSGTRINGDIRNKLSAWGINLLSTLPNPDARKRRRT
jgi:glutamyl endopeptidase